MLKKRRTWLILLAIIVITVGAYFEPTYCVRGWLHGEAFFDGRPTSFWRVRCDQWLARNETAEHAARAIGGESDPDDPDDDPSNVTIPVHEPPPTLWTRFQDFFRPPGERQRAPECLQGHTGSVAVLQELAAEEKYKRIAERGIRHHDVRQRNDKASAESLER